MKQVYVFLANTIAGISGGAIYIRNKSRFLKEQGWDFLAFDNFVVREDVVFEELQPFEFNRYPELQFPPSWFSNSRRTQILNSIIFEINKTSAEQCVIESTQIVLSLWGELLASQLGCKHILFNINEHNIISNDDLFHFLNKKKERFELFTISPQATTNLFSNYIKIVKPEQYCWNAGVSNDVEDISIPELDAIHECDFCIGYFGRPKRFLPYVFRQVQDFSIAHKDKTIYFICMGITYSDINISETPSNLQIILLKPMSPIPKIFYEKTNVVIATAGCAAISKKYSPAVISMSVLDDDRPLGILGRTTNSISYVTDDNNDKIVRPLTTYLEYVFTGEYLNFPISEQGAIHRGYDYQLKFTSPINEAIPVIGIKYIQTYKQWIEYICIRLNCINLVIYLKSRIAVSLRKIINR